MIILVFGLPGSGKTSLASTLSNFITNNNKSCMHINADEVRKLHNDWDFSYEGRLRQAKRMKHIASVYHITHNTEYVITDFVAPTQEIRSLFNPDYSIWMNTITSGRFQDTNNIFEQPIEVNLEIRSFDYEISKIFNQINSISKY